ncbi:hypothetical protein EVAR_39686_1 [Eumeta japonica]|uniref:Uncharacterized protein n=1 Tax=Eumeta variegata TaxID=151549 RepID=A0A4C1Z8L5_EUMVA|nr:hypothetical protein EVAR_39686_1 [Eumeta japonica]
MVWNATAHLTHHMSHVDEFTAKASKKLSTVKKPPEWPMNTHDTREFTSALPAFRKEYDLWRSGGPQTAREESNI